MCTSENANAIQVLDHVQQLLVTIKTVDEAKEIRDQAEALRAYIKQRHRGLELQNHCAFVKILAECRAGRLLREVERAQGNHNGNGLRSAMERSGIAPATGHRWQIMALVPEESLHELWTRADAQGRELTSTAIYRAGNALNRGWMRVEVGGELRITTEEKFERLLRGVQQAVQEERSNLIPCLSLNALRHLLAELLFLRDRVGTAIGVVSRQIDEEVHYFRDVHEEPQVAPVGSDS